VMQEVSVIVPWHVALRDTVVRYLPATPAGRAAAFAVASLSAAAISGGLIWIVSQGNVPLALTSVAETQMRDLLVNSGTRVVGIVFGEEALAFLARSGTAGLAALLAGLVAVTTGTVASLRAIALAASRRRN
jgi:Na+-transporting NADH:ubiquinone oxidoreductase subunit NqrB